MCIYNNEVTAMPSKNHYEPWDIHDLRRLRAFAKRGYSARETAGQLGRTTGAVKFKAMTEGVSFRALPPQQETKRGFTSCIFIGDPPAPHISWHDWANADNYCDVTIMANKALPPTDGTEGAIRTASTSSQQRCTTCGGSDLHGPACKPLDKSDAALLADRLRTASKGDGV
jgi:hypothetical protein